MASNDTPGMSRAMTGPDTGRNAISGDLAIIRRHYRMQVARVTSSDEVRIETTAGDFRAVDSQAWGSDTKDHAAAVLVATFPQGELVHAFSEVFLPTDRRGITLLSIDEWKEVLTGFGCESEDAAAEALRLAACGLFSSIAGILDRRAAELREQARADAINREDLLLWAGRLDYLVDALTREGEEGEGKS